MTIHTDHPFLDPEPDPLRRLRGQLGGRVALWTSGEDDRRAGLTVSSLMVAAGEPACVVALLDPDSDLAETFERTKRAVVHLLGWRHRDLADRFAGIAPAPGGVFGGADRDRWRQTAYGPRLSDADAWAAVSLGEPRFERATTVGWSWLVSGVVEELEVGRDSDDSEPLFHRRGRYVRQ